MVIQRGRPVVFFGTAPVDAEVSVSFDNTTIPVRSDGRWEAQFPALPAGGPHRLAVSCGTERLEVSDILAGEVWVAAGQSNMELPLDRTTDWPGEARSWVRSPRIREFSAPVNPEFNNPRSDLPGGRWRRADSDQIGQLSSLGYHFATEIGKVFDVPVGIILIAIGGSPAEAWIDKDTVTLFPEFEQSFAESRSDSWRATVVESDERRISRWHRELNAADPGLDADSGVTDNPEWHEEGWRRMSIPAGRGDGTVGNGPGSVWIKKTFHATANQTRFPARLRLGAMVDGDRTWINGIEVGSTGYQYPPRRYTVPEGVIREGTNELLIRIVSPEVPARFVSGKRYDISWESGREIPPIELTGTCEAKAGVAAEPLEQKTFIEWKPVGLFNSRVAPISRLAVRGVIWYQGESNTARPAGYANLFRSLVRCWRRAWNDGNLPFLCVQLANFHDPTFLNRANGWAVIREAQRECRNIPGTDMATAIDLGETNDLHPSRKRELAARLALLARRLAYGDESVRATVPHPVSVTATPGGIVRVELASAEGMPARKLTGFEIGNVEGMWRAVPATLLGGRPDGSATIELSSTCGNDDRFIRFAWADDPLAAFPQNEEGFPLEPFREKIDFIG